MRAKQEAQQLVQRLRRQGLSYREIRQQVPVSKSSISLWCRTVQLSEAQQQVLLQRKSLAGQQGLMKIAELLKSGATWNRTRPRPFDEQEVKQIRELYEQERLSFREVASRMGISRWRVYGLMQRAGITRRNGSEQNYATYKHKPQFSPKQTLTPDEERLRVAGTMLYLAEGAKRGKTVDFTNSDPRLITLFLAFLRQICGVSESRLRAEIYAYADQDLEALYTFWLEQTSIPRNQFTKPYVRPLTPNVSGRKMGVGLLHVRYSDGRLLQLLNRWGEELCQTLGRYLSG